MSCHSHIKFDYAFLAEMSNRAYTLRYLEKDYKGAYSAYLFAATQGNAESQFELARLYHYGLGVAENHQKAFEWYLKAAKNGVSHAYRTVADCFLRGDLGVEINEHQAFYWYKKDGEHTLKQLNQNSKVWGERAYELFSILSQCCERGIGTEMSAMEAELWKDKINLIKDRDYKSIKHPREFDITSYRNHYSSPSQPAACKNQDEKGVRGVRKLRRLFRAVFSWVLTVAILVIVLWLIHLSLSPDKSHYTGWEDDPPSPYEKF